MRGGVPGFTPSRSREMLNTKETSAPGPRLPRTARLGFIPSDLLANLFQRQKAPHLLMSDPQASEPANEPAEADPRAPMKAHLYRMAQSAFELQLHREFPKYKTMLEGWDGQQFFWQKVSNFSL